MRFDLTAIGAGPARWPAALQGVKLGMSGSVIEKGLMLGGAYVRTGTLPSKTLRHTALELANSRRAVQLGIHTTHLRPLAIQDLRGPRNQSVASHQQTVRSFFERNKVQVLTGSASFIDPNHVRISDRLGEEIVEAKHLIIATGSRPRRPRSAAEIPRHSLPRDAQHGNSRHAGRGNQRAPHRKTDAEPRGRHLPRERTDQGRRNLSNPRRSCLRDWRCGQLPCTCLYEHASGSNCRIAYCGRRDPAPPPRFRWPSSRSPRPPPSV